MNKKHLSVVVCLLTQKQYFFSAGVGRTGTFITVDYLMQYVEDHDLSSQVDIFDWVIQMRDHRTTMVQTWVGTMLVFFCVIF